MKQYLLQSPDSYFWLWWEDERGQPQLGGPYSAPVVNLPVIQVENPVGFIPKEATDE